jgi:xanthine dehydrogenase small subunit
MRDSVRFLLGTETRELRDVDPTLTVLRYLREVERRAGTKEGCAEGDCGACTVVVGELGPDGMTYRAVNSCIQFVPLLDGKQLLTVEDLKGADGALHPAQAAMCESHASQCGFCTPGFVMSMAAQAANGATPDRAEWKDVLAGNLCRCTGYGPILEAGLGLNETTAELPDVSETLRGWQNEGGVDISAEGRRYFAPHSLSELAQLRLDHPDARIISGLTDVGLWVTKQHRDLGTVIYLGNVDELKHLDVTDTHITIGAGVTLADAHDVLGHHFPDFGELIRRFASLQIRNVATIGGNIANGSPIGDTPPVLIALDAQLILQRGSDRRTIALEDFFIAYGKQDLKPDEFVVGIEVPMPSPERSFRCYKLSKRFDQDISAVCAAFSATITDGKAADVRVAYGGMAGIPQRAAACEAALNGKPWTRQTVTAAMDALESDFQPLTDMRGSASYRMKTARNLLLKFFLETSDTASKTRVLEPVEVAHG